MSAAELGTTSAAADAHFMSQSAMSSALTDLERVLGIQLLVRSKAKGVRPTAAGHRLLPQARALLSAAADLHAHATDLEEGLSGPLVIGCHLALAPYLLPRLIHDFGKRHPAVEIDFIEGSHPDLERLLFEGRCEIAITYDLAAHPRIERQPLYAAQYHVLLPGGHRLCHQESVSLAALAPEPVVFLDVSPGEYFWRAYEAAGATPNVRFRTVTFEHARALVARGLAYTLVAHRVQRERPPWGPEVVSKPLNEDVPRLPVAIAHAAGARQTRRARTFTAYCVEALREPAPG